MCDPCLVKGLFGFGGERADSDCAANCIYLRFEDMEDNNKVETEKDEASRKGEVDAVIKQYPEYKEETCMAGKNGEIADTGSKQHSNHDLSELAYNRKVNQSFASMSSMGRIYNSQ